MGNCKRLTNTSLDSRNSGAVRLFCDTQTALKRLKQYEDSGLSPEEVQEFTEKQIPKEPRWEGGTSFYDDDATAYCSDSECDYYFDKDYIYCPGCGKKILWP